MEAGIRNGVGIRARFAAAEHRQKQVPPNRDSGRTPLDHKHEIVAVKRGRPAEIRNVKIEAGQEEQF